MSWFRFAIRMLALSAVVGLAPQAWAASISINQNIIVERGYNRPSDTEPLQISLRDCQEEAPVLFPVTIQAERVRPLQIWVGQTACDSNQRRSEFDCRLIATGEYGSGARDISLTAKEIVGDDCVGLQMASPPVTVALFFAFIGDNGAPNPEESVIQTMTYDVIAPDPPTLNSLNQGDGQLIPQWGALNASDVVGYRFYCDSSSGPALPGAAGAAGAGSLAECASALVTGEIPSEDYSCGEQEGQSAGRGTIRGLTNLQEYAVGVVSTDTVGNVGALSNVLCQTPEEVVDFYEAYTEAGGQGGGGFCSVGWRGRPLNAELWGLLLGVAVGAARRKKQRS